jgi:hypothetical protein
MTRLADDLRAARALIDTPRKYRSLGIVPAIERVTGKGTKRNWAVRLAVGKTAGPLLTNWADHRAALDRLDRAIASAEAQGGE